MGLKINLGCGLKKEEGMVNVDIDPDVLPDVCHNLEHTPLPFSNGSAELVYAGHVIEHVYNWIALMKDIHRVLEVGGKLVVKIPEYPCRLCFTDPTHIQHFVLENFMFFSNPKWFSETRFSGKGLFKVISVVRTKWKFPQETNGDIGSHLTELHIELEKVGSDYKWEDSVSLQIMEKIVEKEKYGKL